MKTLLAAILVCASPAFSAAPAWDLTIADDFVAMAFAAACEEKAITAWTCPWCAKTGGDYAKFAPDVWVQHAPTKGAAFTGYNAKTNEVFVVFRSTVLTEWRSVLVDFTFDKVDFKSGGSTRGQVHKGFSEAYFALGQAGAFASLEKLLKAHPDAGLVAVGHSLGGALATLAAADFTTRFPGKSILVYSFGSPRVGDRAFAEWFATLPVTYFRVVTADDPVPHAPKLAQGFLHVGSGQEKWFKNIGDAKPVDCPIGENGKCANTVKLPTNFAGAHASYVGHKFDQCGLGPMADAQAWGQSALGELGDSFEEAKKSAADDVSDAADDAADKLKKAKKKLPKLPKVPKL